MSSTVSTQPGHKRTLPLVLPHRFLPKVPTNKCPPRIIFILALAVIILSRASQEQMRSITIPIDKLA